MKGRKEAGGRKRSGLSAVLAIVLALLMAVGAVPAGIDSGSIRGALQQTGVVLAVDAKESTTNYVTTTGLNVRASASTSAKKLGSFAKGATVKVYSISDGWAKISYNSGTAYVSSKYLTKAASGSGGGGTTRTSSSGTSAKSGMVWISETGSKYHRINNCGRMNPNKAWQESKEDAIAQGYEACKNCW